MLFELLIDVGARNVPDVIMDPPPRLMRNCVGLPIFFTQVVMEHVGVCMNTSVAQRAIPNPGAERNVIGSVMSIVRHNMSVQTFSVERVWLQGCDTDMPGHSSWFELLAAYIPDMSSSRYVQPSSIKARYLPDTIRVDLTGLRFAVTVLYDVDQFGVHAGSGTATVTGAGSLWLDGISLRLADVWNEHNVSSIGCGGNIEIEKVEFNGDYSHTEGLYMSEGILRPDIVGYVCDGFERQMYSPFVTGWEWLGPGERSPSLRETVAGFIQSVCAEPTLVERAVGRCCLPYTWPVAALHIMMAAVNVDPVGFTVFVLIAVYVLLYCVRLRQIWD